MSYYFSLDDIRSERINARIFSHKFERMHNIKVDNLKSLCGRLPEDNECFFLKQLKALMHLHL